MNFDTASGQELAEFRKARGLNQSQFWERTGVTQSAGSRYESGGGIPIPVRLLLEVAYSDKPYKVVARIRGERG